MSRLRAALGVLVAVVAAAGVFMLRDGPETSPVVTTRPMSVPAEAPGTLPVQTAGGLVAVDVAASGRLPFRVRSLARRQVIVRVFSVRSSGRTSPLGTARSRTDRAGRGVLGVDRRLAGRLRRCSVRAVVLRVRARRGPGRATVRLAMQRTPPACARFFSADSIWNTPLPDNLPLDRQSDRLSGQLASMVRDAVARRFGPQINIGRYSVPVYTVPVSTRRVPVEIDVTDYGRGIRQAFARGVPIPKGARPAAGDDGHLVVWQPSTDTMWELFKARRAADGWHARFGGVQERVSASPGVFRDSKGTPAGATASSLSLVGGLITMAELRRGRIDHALALALPKTRASYWSLPAQRTDGFVKGVAIPQGARFRLDPRLDVAGLRLPPVVRMMAEAAQRYGVVVRDTAATPTFYAEDPRGGPSPYRELFNGAASYELAAAFPWSRLQLTAMHLRTYGGSSRPVPDDHPQAPSSPASRPLCQLYGTTCR